MSKEDNFKITPPTKKLRFRGDSNLYQQFDSRVQDIYDEEWSRNGKNGDVCDGKMKGFFFIILTLLSIK